MTPPLSRLSALIPAVKKCTQKGPSLFRDATGIQSIGNPLQKQKY
jgi:hypothetical protein